MELSIIELNMNRSLGLFDSEECRMLLKTYDAYYQEIGFNVPWVGYFVLNGGQVVGSCGYTGQPKDGKVEIAYWTFKRFENKGIASFSCKALISIAQQFDPTITITPKRHLEYNASTKILQSNGFVFTRVVQDHEIGDAWLWTLF
ncbi:MAG: GNAT family N-acetyltransferase [Saprospiraceae bacterium]|nr:GNAT family N-acetyltransferase [Saprospiraceae bacterium]